MKSLILGLLAAAVASPAHGDSTCPGNQLIAVKNNHRNVQCPTADASEALKTQNSQLIELSFSSWIEEGYNWPQVYSVGR